MQKQEIIVINSLRQRPPSQQILDNVSITVEEPQLTDSYYTYKIVGTDKEGAFSIRRRYSDFDLLRKRLAQRWLGIYIPPISGKRADNNFLHVFKIFDDNTNEARYAQTRKRFLRYFCQGIAIRPYLYYCDLFQLFIRGGPDYETAIAPCINKQYNFLLNAYQLNFNRLIPQNQELQIKVLIIENEKHLTILKDSEKTLQNIYEKMFKAAQARQEFNKQFNIVTMKTLPDYQQNCLLNHLTKNRQKLIIKRTQAFNLKLTQLQTITEINPLEQFMEMIMYEIREVKAFIEAIEGRKQAEKRKCELKEKIVDKQNSRAKLQKGEFSFKSFFKGVSRDLQIEQISVKIEVLRNQLVCLQKMILLMVANTNYQLMEYRMRRGKEYNQMFKKAAEMELVELAAYEELLKIPLAILE